MMQNSGNNINLKVYEPDTNNVRWRDLDLNRRCNCQSGDSSDDTCDNAFSNVAVSSLTSLSDYDKTIERVSLKDCDDENCTTEDNDESLDDDIIPEEDSISDDEIDEESGATSKDFMTEKYRKDNDKKLDALADSVTQIKNLSKNIGSQMEEEKTTIGQLDGGFQKSKELVNKIVGSMDTMLN